MLNILDVYRRWRTRQRKRVTDPLMTLLETRLGNHVDDQLNEVATEAAETYCRDELHIPDEDTLVDHVFENIHNHVNILDAEDVCEIACQSIDVIDQVEMEGYIKEDEVNQSLNISDLTVDPEFCHDIQLIAAKEIAAAFKEFVKRFKSVLPATSAEYGNVVHAMETSILLNKSFTDSFATPVPESLLVDTPALT